MDVITAMTLRCLCHLHHVHGSSDPILCC